MSLPMATPQPQTSSSDIQEHVVRVPRERRKKYSMMKIGSGIELDFSKLHQAQTPVRIEKENNFKEFKNAYDIDTLPKFGAGSEYGRQQKEEARRKKYGIRTKKYNPEDQPWVLKVGQGKNTKKYKGVREGTISDNTSYYIFTKCADGAFEAVPVEEWYNYTPQIAYKFLNSEEAEEEFNRRDKNLNLFNIMVKKRVRNDAAEAEEEAGEKVKKGGKKKDLQLTDMDDWAALSDEEDDEDDDDDEDAEKAKKKPSKGKGKGKVTKKKNAKHNSDDEAIEESDEGDYDDREVDYMSDSGMSSTDSEPEGKEKKAEKYEEKGVDEEAGLRKLIDSEEEDEEEEEKNEDNEEEKEKEGKGKKTGSDSDSSSSSSDSDSDMEKDDKISSALFMQTGSEKKKERTASPKPEERGTKRKGEGESTTVKKARTESPLTTQGSIGGSSEGITEESIRRYLMRKPMTTKDLLQKFRSKKLNMTNEQMTHLIAQILKRINPEKQYINKVMYLSLKSE